MRFEKNIVCSTRPREKNSYTSFMRPTLKVSRLDPEFIHSRKSNEGEKFTTKWPVNFKRFTRMIKIGGVGCIYQLGKRLKLH